MYADVRYSDVIMTTMASQITSLAIVYSTFYPGADQRKHQSSASLAFVRGIHRGPVNSPPKRPVARKMFLFDDVIMASLFAWYYFLYARFMPWQCPSVRPSVCPSVRPSAISGLFLNMLWDINLKLGIYIQCVARHVEFELHHNWVTLT